MKLTISYIRNNWKLKTWRCCGQQWEIIITPKMSSRESFKPTCEKCGKVGKS